ncbi:MAG: 3-isopropylmalate dehydratase small subunit [Thermovirgaceae bacterium]|nr:3-isopropylmalate dehydratase small subunit [Thermovirgaceae bacterium]
MRENIRGKAWVFANDVDTDVIIPARYLVTDNPEELGAHCMEGIDPDFSSTFTRGDIIVAGENFGCGSSREHAPVALMGAGCACVIAASFARIFYRNSINVGLPIFEAPDAARSISRGDEIEIRSSEGRIINTTTGESWNFPPFPDFLQDLIESGGLIPWVRSELEGRG